MTKMQDIDNDIRFELTNDWFEGKLDVVEISYDYADDTDEVKNQSEATRASLSWHLTTKEKQHIIQSIKIDQNKNQIQQLKGLIKSSLTP